MVNAVTMTGTLSYARSGAAAGAISTLAFTVVHQVFISNIWHSFPLMLIAGGLCGLCIGWSFKMLVRRHGMGDWLQYNLLYLALLMLLGLSSAIFFEPEVSMVALMAANGPPSALIAKALPMTFAFTLLGSLGVSLLYGPTIRRFSAALLTTSVLVLLLGLNVSVLGLVSIPRGSLYLVVEFLSLIVLLDIVYAAAFVAFERENLLADFAERKQP